MRRQLLVIGWLGILFGIGFVIGTQSPAEASGVCGIPRVDCTSGNVEPANKIVIPEAQVTGLSTSLSGKVGTATTVCGHALSSNVCPTAAEVNAVSTATTVCGHALSSNVCPTAAEVGAMGDHTVTFSGGIACTSSTATTTTTSASISTLQTVVCNAASSSAAGCMSAADKAKLDAVALGDGALYFDDSASDVSTYHVLSSSPVTGTAEETDGASVTVGDGEVLIESYVTSSGFPGTTLWAGGTWYFDLYRYVSSAANTSELIVRVYRRTAAGSETELFNVTTGTIAETSVTLQEVTTTQGAFVTASTDRLVTKLFAKTTGAAARTVYFTHNGTEHYSHIHSPLTASVPDLSGIYVPWINVEGTGTATSTASSKLVNAADGRLSDARAPTGSIYAGPGAALTSGTSTSTTTAVALSAGPKVQVLGVTEAMQSLTDTTVGNVSIATHGYAPKAPNDATKCLVGDGTWTTCPGGGGPVAFTTLYDINFATVTSATTGTSTTTTTNLLTGGDGVKVIGGKSWTLVNSSNLSVAAVNDGTHAGLYLKCNTTATYEYSGSVASGAIYTSLANLATGLGILSSGINEMWITYQIEVPRTPANTSASAYAGIVQDYTIYNTTLNRFQLRNVGNGVGVVAYGQAQLGVNDDYRGGVATPAQDVFAFFFRGFFNGSQIIAYSGATTGGALPAHSALSYMSAAYTNQPAAGAGRLHSQFYPYLRMGVASGDTAGLQDILIKRIVVEYR